MAAPNQNTWDLVPPRRPGTNDFNGIAKTDDPAYTPDVTTQPNAAEWNTVEFLINAFAKVMPSLIISITGGVTPGIAFFTTPASAPVLGTFTVTRNSIGNVSITWPANTFPPSVAAPSVALNAGALGNAVDIVAITNGIQVRTSVSSTGAGADLSFTATVY